MVNRKELRQKKQDKKNRKIKRNKKEFKGQKRRNTILFFLLMNIFFISLIIFDDQTTSLEDVHQYNTITTSAMKCTTGEQYSGDTYIRSYHILEITAFDDVFIASRLPKEICQFIVKNYPAGSEVNIWNDEGYVYQLMSGETMLLSYEALKDNVNIRKEERDRTLFHIFWLVTFLFFSTKPFLRAVLNKQEEAYSSVGWYWLMIAVMLAFAESYLDSYL